MEYDRKYLLLRLLLLYLLVVTRVCGAQLAGFYSLSYATAPAASAGGTLWCPHLSGHGSGAQIYFFRV